MLTAASAAAKSASRPFAAPADESTAFDLLQGLVREVPGLISDRVELFALELGRAGGALAKIVALTVAVAILGITAWLALWAGVVMGLIALGWHFAVALAVVILINAGAVAWALMRMRELAGLLKLPATRRHLTMRGSARAAAADEVALHEPFTSVPGTPAHASPGTDLPGDR